MEIDFNTKCQILDDISTVEHLLSLNPFCTITDREVQKAIFTEIMICLRDLVAKSTKVLHKKIDFDDDVIIISQPQSVSNVTDLISFVRNALCHQDSENHKFDSNNNIVLSYNVLIGKAPNIINIDGKRYWI